MRLVEGIKRFGISTREKSRVIVTHTARVFGIVVDLHFAAKLEAATQ